MCLIIVNKEAKAYDKGFLERVHERNDDGISSLIIATGEIKRDITVADVMELKEGHILHFRFKTKGGLGVDHMHPFKIKEDKWLFHNGTIAYLGDTTKSDTAEMARLLSESNEKIWSELLTLLSDGRFVVYDGADQSVKLAGPVHGELKPIEKAIAHGKQTAWYNIDGVLYSNNPHDFMYPKPAKINTTAVTQYKRIKRPTQYLDHYTPYYDNYNAKHYEDLSKHTSGVKNDKTGLQLVFVYGTLKKGFGNHRYLEKATSCGKATAEGYKIAMENSLPYLHADYGPVSEIKTVKGELYGVSAEELYNLDLLEGHPDHYKRRLLFVSTGKNTQHTAWAYFDAQWLSGQQEREDTFYEEYKTEMSYSAQDAEFDYRKGCQFCGKIDSLSSDELCGECQGYREQYQSIYTPFNQA